MNRLSASRLSLILTIGLIGLLVILVAGSGFVASRLIHTSRTATDAQVDADVSAGDASRVAGLKSYLAANANGISQTAALTAGLGQYNQTQIVATITGYANKAGVTVSGFNFGNGSGTGASTGAAAAAATPTANANTVSLSFGQSLPYQNFIVFLRLLEQGLMPATVTGGSISPSSTDPTQVIVTGFTVQVAGQ